MHTGRRMFQLLPLTAFLFLLGGAFAFADGPPSIQRMLPDDSLFKQFQADVEEGRMRLAAEGLDAEQLAGYLTVYRYRSAADKEDIFSIAARSNLPYSTIATANRLSNPHLAAGGKELLLPSMPGLFIPETPDSDLERLLAHGRQDQPGISVALRREGEGGRFKFLPGADFNPTERAFFLNAAFRYPLPAFRLTSTYGVRRNPVTGTVKVHEGLDLAAPEGTEVLAARDGTVKGIGVDPIFGKYIVIEHEAGWTSLYGHLSAVLTDLQKTVRSGTLIGRVGSTGQSTGPHLHFELRQNGTAKNPSNLLPSKGSER